VETCLLWLHEQKKGWHIIQISAEELILVEIELKRRKVKEKILKKMLLCKEN